MPAADSRLRPTSPGEPPLVRSVLSSSRALALLLLVLAAPLRAEELTVRVLHTTDLHGTLVGWDDVKDQPLPRGLERLATGIAAARAEGAPTLLVDAGDALSGSSLVRAWREGDRSRPEPIVTAMNRLGYDALAVGNHEFDGGRVALDSARARARFPFLAANVLDARTRQPAFGTSLVRDVQGARIGIVGLTSPALPMLMDTSLCAGLVFVDPIEIARREVTQFLSTQPLDEGLGAFFPNEGPISQDQPPLHRGERAFLVRQEDVVDQRHAVGRHAGKRSRTGITRP